MRDPRTKQRFTNVPAPDERDEQGFVACVADAHFEVAWYFLRADGDMGLVSNLPALRHVSVADEDKVEDATDGRTPEDYFEAARARRKIQGWLRAMPDAEAGVLQAAYEPRIWPTALVRELGKLTGIVVRLACAADRWPDDARSQEFLLMFRAGCLEIELEQRGPGRRLEVLRARARARYRQAIAAYLAVRGPGPRLPRADVTGPA